MHMSHNESISLQDHYEQRTRSRNLCMHQVNNCDSGEAQGTNDKVSNLSFVWEVCGFSPTLVLAEPEHPCWRWGSPKLPMAQG